MARTPIPPRGPVIIEKSLDGRVTEWSAGAAGVFGYAPREIIGRHVSMIIPFDWRDEEYEMTDRMREGEITESRHTVRRTQDGTYVWVDLVMSPIFDSRGKIVGAEQQFSNFSYYRDDNDFVAAAEACPENSRLFCAYARAVALWSRRTAELAKQAGVKSDCYAAMLRSAGAARVSANKAKDAYKQHIARHGCSVTAPHLSRSTEDPRRFH